ncbi:MAG: hypothetical protein ACFFE4_00365, partial [Candidatus Thorarchaeota archaeon]
LTKEIGFKEWHDLIRDNLVDRDFIITQSDKLQKFFKLEISGEHESPIQFFFQEIHENALVIGNRKNLDFYNELFEKYTYKISKSLYNEELIETLRILIKIFFKNKKFVNLTDYLDLYSDLLENKEIVSNLSLKKFYENLQWINKCTSIAPSYQSVSSAIGISPLLCNLTFNPLLERRKVRKLLENFPFWSSPRLIENSFASKVVATIMVPTVYLRDVLNYLRRLLNEGYLIDKQIFLYKSSRNFLNLNYFTDISNTTKIIDPLLKKYKKKYECEHFIEFLSENKPYPLSIFDYTIFERIKYVSVTGLTFDKRIETLNAIKEDIENENRKQVTYLDQFQASFNKLLESTPFTEELVKFIDKNHKLGIFYLRETFFGIIKLSELIEKILRENPKIINSHKLFLFLKENTISQLLEDNIIIQNSQVKNFVMNSIIPKYFQSVEVYEEEILKFKIFHDIINSCINLKIFNLKRIKNIINLPNSVLKITNTIEFGLKKAFKEVKSYKITNQKIESVINTFLSHDPPIIVPLLLNTVYTSQFAKYYPGIILKSSPNIQKKIQKFRSYFPRIFLSELLNLDSQELVHHVFPYSVNMLEKGKFVSGLYHLFKDNLITVHRNYWRGTERIAKINAKDFYDYEKQQFVYSKDYFEQLFLYTKNIFDSYELERYDKKQVVSPPNLFWALNFNIRELVKGVRKRASQQLLRYNQNQIHELTDFLNYIEQNLLDKDKFSIIKSSDFFKTYVKSIKFIPAFRKYGLAQYYLYFCPLDWNEIDSKLLLINSFQNVKHPAQIDSNQPVLIKTLFPYRTPNKTYLNWLTKSKKVVRESCLFFIKKFFDISQFDFNLSPSGWHYSSNRFKIHIQKVLFSPKYDPQMSSVREFNIDQYPESGIYDLEAPEFKSLKQIYQRRPLDLKLYLGTNRYNYINSITSLLDQQLIFPYIHYKNLGFRDKILIILPKAEKKLENKLIGIFNFFNVCRIYEIEGEFFIYGFEDMKSFETGYMIEVWFPMCEMDEFLDVFDLLFEYLDIKHYLILTDLVNGDVLLKNTIGDLGVLEHYYPLTNLKWNKKDKMWMNHKIFNEKFEPLYPDLFYGSKN